jgi:F0F1-type ATP synthase epsilon subunit
MTAMRQDASTGQMVEVNDDPAANANKSLANGKPVMGVKVYAPFKVYYEGEAHSLTAVNETGPFDILPHHHNFICMLLPCDLIVETPHGQQTIKISRALMHVKAEQVTIFVDV